MLTTEPLTDLAAFGEQFTRDPYPVYAALREKGPVHRVRIPEGADAWLVVGHDIGRTLLADQRFSKHWDRASPALGVVKVSSGTSMLSTDAPDHTRLRKLVAREFTPRRMERLAPRVQEMTDALLDTMLSAPDRTADLVEALSFPLPMSVICELLGVPSLDREKFRTWSGRALSSTDRAVRAASAEAMTAYISGLLDDKRAQSGGDDLLSALIHTADEGGDRLSGDELVGMAWLLLVAGHETTVNLITNGVHHLLAHPDQLALLRADFSPDRQRGGGDPAVRGAGGDPHVPLHHRTGRDRRDGDPRRRRAGARRPVGRQPGPGALPRRVPVRHHP